MIRKAVVFPLLVVSLLIFSYITAKLVKSKTYYWLDLHDITTSVNGKYEVEPTDLFLVVADHWEPGSGSISAAEANRWLTSFQMIADKHVDSFGRKFQYTWFYPIDNFDPAIINMLVTTARSGLGEIEVHWHHKHESSDEFEKDLLEGIDGFLQSGALSRAQDGSPKFVFVHGNWSLDNSRGDRYCGIDDEIDILLRNGAVADMTFPALGTAAQPASDAKIYYARDTSAAKSYDVGSSAVVGKVGDGLLMVNGPLGLDWEDPLIMFEYGALDDAQGTGFSGRIKRPANPADYFKDHRAALWAKLGGRVKDKPEWVFVKLHSHGMQHSEILLGGLLDRALDALRSYADANNISLHFVTAREMVNVIRAVEENEETGTSLDYDYWLSPPPFLESNPNQPAQSVQ